MAAAAGCDVASTETDNQSETTYILREYLPLYPHSKPLYRVTVTEGYISWEPTTRNKRGSLKSRQDSLKHKRSSSKWSLSDDAEYAKTRQVIVSKGGLFISMDDIIGCDCMRGKKLEDTSTYLTIYAYPMKKKLGTHRTTRKREEVNIIFDGYDTYEENMKEAQKWGKIIHCLTKKINLSDVQDFSNLTIPSEKKMFILVNPFGGKGKALQLFQQRIVPILAEASISHEMVVTEYAGHAKDIMYKIDMKAWYGVLIVSGDGLVHEVINGLMERSDWREAIKLPIGVLPGGSGNALCCALGYQTGEPYLDNPVVHACFTIAKHSVVPLDLIAIDTFQGKRFYSFLSCCWGLMADVDIESEKYRKLGNARFTIGALVRIIGLRKYRGRVSFLPIDGYTPLNEAHNAVDDRPSAANHSASTREPLTSEPAPTELNTEPVIQSELRNGHDDSSDQTGNVEKVELKEDVAQSSVPTPLLVPLNEPVPQTWVTLEGEFVNVAAIYLTHLAKDMIAVPQSRLDDGIIYLSVTKGAISRRKLIGIMTAMQDGSYTGSPESEVIKVKAFRFEPEEKDGIMTCDGEKIAYGPIQGQVLPSVANIMSLKKQTTSHL